MKYPIIDTHTHLYFDAFDPDREEVVQRNLDAGIIHEIQIGCDEASSMAAIELAKEYGHMSAIIGLHPCDVETVGHAPRFPHVKGYTPKAQNIDELFEIFDQMYQDNKEYIVGFGETGFDLYHQNTPELFALQEVCFRKHLDLCEKYDLPVMIHSRNAGEQLLDFFSKHIQKGKHRGVVHCFSEDAAFAEIVTQKYGFHIGIGGVATMMNAEGVRHAIERTPIEHIITETDAPFIVPRQMKKSTGMKRNESGFLPEVVELIAEIKGLDPMECAEVMVGNAKKLFNI